MARSVNKIILIGNIGHDPELRYLPSGTPVANTSLATNETRQDQNGQQQTETTWFRLTAFGKLAEIVQQYFQKGTLAYVEGRVKIDQWEDQNGNPRTGVSVIIRDIQNLSGKGESQSTGGYQSGPTQYNQQPPQQQYNNQQPPQQNVQGPQNQAYNQPQNQPTSPQQNPPTGNGVATPPPGGDIPDPFDDDAPF